MHDPYAHRRGEPRTFAAAWVAYLFSGVAVALLGVGTLGLVATDVYRAAARLMIVITFVAVWIFWPMVRLSQDAPKRPVAAFASDFVLVLLPAYAVIWPQTLAWMAAWPAEVCLGLTLLVTAWAALAAAVLTWYFGRRPPDEAPAPARGLMMAGFVAVACAGTLVSVLSGVVLQQDRDFDAAAMLSPVGGALQLVADKSAVGAAAMMTREHWVMTLVLLAVCLFVWGLAALLARDEG